MRKIILTWLALTAALFGAWQLSAPDIPHFKSAHIERLLVSPAHAQLSLTGAGAGAPSSGGGGCTFPSGIGLVARYRADTGISTSSGNVTAVTDQSGNGNSLTVTGTVPWSATASAHGQPAFNFLAADNGALNTSGLTINMGTASPFLFSLSDKC